MRRGFMKVKLRLDGDLVTFAASAS
jgi:hypothetical protein